MNDRKMTDILKGFDKVVTTDQDKPLTEVTPNKKPINDNAAMKKILEGLDAQQRSVNQMPGTHVMGKSDANHPASKFLVGGEYEDDEQTIKKTINTINWPKEVKSRPDQFPGEAHPDSPDDWEDLEEAESTYASAIKTREEAIGRLKTNPPAEWSPEYVQKNIKEIQDQIDTFKERDASPVKEATKEKSKDNFTADDLQELNSIKDLDQLKQRAIELISAESDRPMKPEKVEWFKRNIAGKTNHAAIIKLMWDLLLAGEGTSVIGTGKSTGKSSYKKKFEEDTISQRKPGSDVHKKQSLSDIFRSMDETEEDMASQFKKELHAGRKARELKKGENGKFNLAEASDQAMYDLRSHIQNLAYFATSIEMIDEEFKVNNGDTFVVLAKKIIEAVKQVREGSNGVQEDSNSLKTKDARAAQLIKKARNQYSGKTGDDLSAVVNMMHDKDLEHDKHIDNLDTYNFDQDTDIHQNADVNDEQEGEIGDILQRLGRLEK